MRSLQQTFARRPRILNVLHALGLVEAHSQTDEVELAALQRHARGRRRAVEIGTFQGVSAVRITRGLAPDGVLYCVDPWREVGGKPNPCWRICRRHLRRSGALGSVRILRGLSVDVAHLLPAAIDFAFIDGDHSYEGLAADWAIVSRRLMAGGVVCLHDTVATDDPRGAVLPSVAYYDEVIARDPAFERIEVVHRMAVLRRRTGPSEKSAA